VPGIRKDGDQEIHVLLKIQRQEIQIKEVSHVLIRKTMLQCLTPQCLILVLTRPHLSHKDWVTWQVQAWLSAWLASEAPLIMFVCVLVAFILQNLSRSILVNNVVAVVQCGIACLYFYTKLKDQGGCLLDLPFLALLTFMLTHSSSEAFILLQLKTMFRIFLKRWIKI